MRNFSADCQRNRTLRIGLVALSAWALLACSSPQPSAPDTGDARLPAVDVSAVAMADTGSRLRPDWQYGAFMEIFVRSYKDSDGDGVGDLRGLIQSLDYLHDLGVRGIWLMPVTVSEDHDHGYATTDYRNIETAYGKLADLDELLAQAHARGMGVIIDYVINHSATQNPLFQHARSSANNRFRDWYVWQDPAPSGWHIFGSDPWYATAHGAYLGQFSSSMPDFNFRNPEVLRYHQDNLRFWLNRGVDGFRFDAVTHLVENGPQAWDDQAESYAVMAQLRSTLKGYGQRYMVCEATAHPNRWAQDQYCGSAFAFGHQQDIVNAARGQAAAIAAVADYFKTAPNTMATMVSNHDLFAGERLWDQVHGDLAHYRLAAATYLLQPGTPFIYYGEEIGMSAAGGLRGDPKLRTPMSWNADSRTAGFTQGKPYRALSANAGTQNVASQMADPDSLRNFYKSLLKLRNDYPSIARGSYEAAFVSGQVLGFQRWLGTEKTWVLINYGKSDASVAVPTSGSSTRLQALYPANRAGHESSPAVQIPAQSLRVFSVVSN